MHVVCTGSVTPAVAPGSDKKVSYVPVGEGSFVLVLLVGSQFVRLLWHNILGNIVY